jgi:predicted glycogen debranching enzyme
MAKLEREAIQQRGTTLEWLEADGKGGFASGTAAGIRTRRYHALLLAATAPPGGRMVLVNGAEVWLDVDGQSYALSSQHYGPDVVFPDGAQRVEAFTTEPWPTWRYRLAAQVEVSQEIVARSGGSEIALVWRLLTPRPGAALRVRLLHSGRDYHALHRENPAFRFAAEVSDATPTRVTFASYPDVPRVVVWHNGRYEHGPDWYRNFIYAQERARGLDDVEDLASPGVFHFSLDDGEAVLILAAEVAQHGPDGAGRKADALPTVAATSAVAAAAALRAAERTRRAAFPSRLHRAADAYLVDRGSGRTVIAGYPWFLDWGRDTFIALRGLCLATGRLEEARAILLAWSGCVSEGMLPNRFPDRGETPEFNSVDASLWFVVAVDDFLARADAGRLSLPDGERRKLCDAVLAIVSGYRAGTRFAIRCDDDGLLAAGVPGVQLTWMDAKVGDWVVTPRIGKPVEVQALWLNALAIARRIDARFGELFERGRGAFRARFWDASRGFLADVVDAGYVAGAAEWSFRPNQILAVGGLPLCLLEDEPARRVVDAVEARLLTPIGLRSLAPDEPGYCPRYVGDVRQRDGAYHQGTVWPWLLGPFVEAWLRVRGDGVAARREARARFLPPLEAHLDDAGLDHVSEVAFAEPPHTPCGCPFQAWSVGEALRLTVELLRER